MTPKVHPSKLLTYIASIFAITLWGMSYIWTDKLIALNIPIFYFVFVRILLAGLVLFLFNSAYGRIKRIQRKDVPKFLLLAFFEPFIYFICETYGLKVTGSPTLSAMIIATIPIFSIGAGMIFFKEKVNFVNIIGISLSLVGIVILLLPVGKASLIGFLVMGFGFGPVFPSVLHNIPERFGTKYSADITGFHMGGAYAIGFGFQLAYGFIATAVSFKITGFLLLALCAGLYLANRSALKKIAESNS